MRADVVTVLLVVLIVLVLLVFFGVGWAGR